MKETEEREGERDGFVIIEILRFNIWFLFDIHTIIPSKTPYLVLLLIRNSSLETGH